MDRSIPPSEASSQKVVYVMPQPMESMGAADDEIDLKELGQTLWQGRLRIAVCAIVCVIAAVVYALMATEWFQAEVVLAPAGKKSTLGGGGLAQLGGLASLAGIDIPGSDGGEPLAVLKSKALISQFVDDEHLLPVLFADKWDAAAGRWKESVKKPPDERDAVKLFDTQVRTITEDKKSGTITMSIKWTDPDTAARWANELVRRLNDRMRTQATEDAERSIEYLQKELLATSVVSLQQSIGRVLEGEMQKMALARANEQFAFKIIDPAVPPKQRASPKRTLIVLVAGLVGLMLGVMWVLISHSLTKTLREDAAGSQP